jgi:predicted DsbA family dithiol-disulfide isomerase
MSCEFVGTLTRGIGTLNNSQPVSKTLTVEIWSDVICPFCPIGERRFETALEAFAHRNQLNVVHRSFRLQRGAEPFRVKDYISRKFGREQADPILEHVSQLAAQVGLTYRQDNLLGGDTLDAHRLLHFARSVGKQKALLDRFYVAYFSEQANLFDHDALTRLAVEVGLEQQHIAAVLASEQFDADVNRDQVEAQALGIQGVPHFLIDSRIAVSGAQEPQTYLDALNSAWNSHQEKTAEGKAASLICDADFCYPPQKH